MHLKLSTLLLSLGVLTMAVANRIGRVANSVDGEDTIPDPVGIGGVGGSPPDETATATIGDPIGITE